MSTLVGRIQGNSVFIYRAGTTGTVGLVSIEPLWRKLDILYVYISSKTGIFFHIGSTGTLSSRWHRHCISILFKLPSFCVSENTSLMSQARTSSQLKILGSLIESMIRSFRDEYNNYLCFNLYFYNHLLSFHMSDNYPV